MRFFWMVLIEHILLMMVWVTEKSDDVEAKLAQQYRAGVAVRKRMIMNRHAHDHVAARKEHSGADYRHNAADYDAAAHLVCIGNGRSAPVVGALTVKTLMPSRV